MIIVRIQGGLGNQLFQYAIGRRLAADQHTELVIDISLLNCVDELTTPREYKLDCFNIVGRISQEGDLDNVLGCKWLRPLKRRLYKMGLDVFHWNYFREVVFGFHPDVVKCRKSAALEGYWQSEYYFLSIRDILLAELTLKDEYTTESFSAIQHEMQTVNSVALHVRRGDYVNHQKINQQFGTCTLEYYAQAIKLMRHKLDEPVFYLFSDDLEWCRENLSDSASFKIVEGFEDYQDLALISSCAHQIIANSSFSWWGAWLNSNPGKIVIAPKVWFANPQIDTRHVVPNDWIRL